MAHVAPPTRVAFAAVGEVVVAVVGETDGATEPPRHVPHVTGQFTAMNCTEQSPSALAEPQLTAAPEANT